MSVIGTVLVTGATGNTGSALVEGLLRRGATVRAMVRTPATARHGRVRDRPRPRTVTDFARDHRNDLAG